MPIDLLVKCLFFVGEDVGQDNIGTELAAESALRAETLILKNI